MSKEKQERLRKLALTLKKAEYLREAERMRVSKTEAHLLRDRWLATSKVERLRAKVEQMRLK